MNPKELKALIKTLRAQGITHYKTQEIELNLAPEIPAPRSRRKTKADLEAEKEIKHRTEELSSLLKISDKDLVDRLFPDHTNYEDEGESQEEPTN